MKYLRNSYHNISVKAVLILHLVLKRSSFILFTRKSPELCCYNGYFVLTVLRATDLLMTLSLCRCHHLLEYLL